MAGDIFRCLEGEMGHFSLSVGMGGVAGAIFLYLGGEMGTFSLSVGTGGCRGHLSLSGETGGTRGTFLSVGGDWRGAGVTGTLFLVSGTWRVTGTFLSVSRGYFSLLVRTREWQGIFLSVSQDSGVAGDISL